MKIGQSRLAATIGPKSLANLAKLVGGTRLYVPLDFDKANRLRSRIGDDLAILLIFHFAGSRFYVPTLKPPAKPSRRQIIALTQAGRSAPEIARRIGCSDRTIHTHRNRKRTKGNTKP